MWRARWSHSCQAVMSCIRKADKGDELRINITKTLNSLEAPRGDNQQSQESLDGPRTEDQ